MSVNSDVVDDNVTFCFQGRLIVWSEIGGPTFAAAMTVTPTTSTSRITTILLGREANEDDLAATQSSNCDGTIPILVSWIKENGCPLTVKSLKMRLE